MKHEHTLLCLVIVVCCAPIFADDCTEQKADVAKKIERLDHIDRNVRLEAIQALGDYGNDAKKAGTKLQELLHDEDREVRGAAVEALVQIGDDAALPALIQVARKDVKESIRVRAAQGINCFGPLDAHQLRDLVSEIRTQHNAAVIYFLAMKVFRQSDAAGVGRELLADKAMGARQRVSLVTAIRRADVNVFVAITPNLLNLLEKDGQEEVRRAVLQVFAAFGDRSGPARDAVVQALAVEQGLNRVEAANALWRIDEHNSKIMPALLKAMDDRDAEVRYLAVMQISLMGADYSRKALKSLIRLLKDPDEQVQLRTCWVIEKIGSQAAAAAATLREVSRDDPSAVVRKMARRCLAAVEGEIGGGSGR